MPAAVLLLTFGALLGAFILGPGCTAPSRTREAAVKAGFTDVEVGGHAWFACAYGDDFATRFSGTNAQGHRVEGAVCCGWLKSCTVRF